MVRRRKNRKKMVPMKMSGQTTESGEIVYTPHISDDEHSSSSSKSWADIADDEGGMMPDDGGGMMPARRVGDERPEYTDRWGGQPLGCSSFVSCEECWKRFWVSDDSELWDIKIPDPSNPRNQWTIIYRHQGNNRLVIVTDYCPNCNPDRPVETMQNGGGGNIYSVLDVFEGIDDDDEKDVNGGGEEQHMTNLRQSLIPFDELSSLEHRKQQEAERKKSKARYMEEKSSILKEERGPPRAKCNTCQTLYSVKEGTELYSMADRSWYGPLLIKSSDCHVCDYDTYKRKKAEKERRGIRVAVRKNFGHKDLGVVVV